MKRFKKHDPRDGWYEIPVAECAELLDAVLDNRPLSEWRAKMYASVMDRGEWVENGQPIILGPKSPLDCQHRLRAAILANKPLRTYVVHVHGTPIEIKKILESLDHGKNRRPAEILAMMGVKYYNTASAVCMKSLHYEQATLVTGGFRAKFPPSSKQIRCYYEKHKRAVDLACATAHNGSHKQYRTFINTSLVAFLHYRACLEDKEKGATFIEALTTGAGLSKSNPVLLLRNKLIDNSASLKKLPEKDVQALCTKAWNAFRSQKTVRALRWDSSREQFPLFG